MTEAEIKELINRRRRQVLVHSVIYYVFNDNLISDSKWSEWARELAQLQEAYPDIAEQCIYADAYRNFDGSSGFDLPLGDGWAYARAEELLRYYDRHIRGDKPLLFRWEKQS